MSDILQIQSPILFDESISQYENHTHKPYNLTTFNNGDEIRIAIQQQDVNLLPSKSYLHVYGRLTKDDDNNAAPVTINLVNNAICHMFREIRYELNGVEIDRNNNVGITTLMKNLISFSPNESNLMENANWTGVGETIKLTNEAGYFDVCIPLSNLLGFAEDYNKIIVNAKHELILTRANSDTNSIIKVGNDDEDATIHISNIEWIMPHVKLSDRHKIKMLDFIAKDKPIPIGYRMWQCFEFPTLPISTKHVWVIKTASQMEKPRFVILGLQTNRKNNANNASQFDHCNVRDVKVFLNSQSYPYTNMNLDFTRNQFSLLYEMYANFKTAYYDKSAKPLLTKDEFLTKSPLFVIDCSKQNESIKSGSVDIRLEIDSVENFPANTSAYCVIIHDRMIEYNPISNIVRKL